MNDAEPAVATDLQALGEHLTPRQRTLVAGVIAGKTQTQAAIDAGYAPTAAKVTASENMHRADVRAYYRALLEQAGIGDQALVGRLKDLMDTMSFGLTKDGSVVEMGPDGTTRVKAVEMAFRLSDAFPNPKLDVTAQVGATIVVRHEDQVGGDPWSGAIDVTPQTTPA